MRFAPSTATSTQHPLDQPSTTLTLPKRTSPSTSCCPGSNSSPTGSARRCPARTRSFSRLCARRSTSSTERCSAENNASTRLHRGHAWSTEGGGAQCTVWGGHPMKTVKSRNVCAQLVGQPSAMRLSVELCSSVRCGRSAPGVQVTTTCVGALRHKRPVSHGSRAVHCAAAP